MLVEGQGVLLDSVMLNWGAGVAVGGAAVGGAVVAEILVAGGFFVGVSLAAANGATVSVGAGVGVSVVTSVAVGEGLLVADGRGVNVGRGVRLGVSVAAFSALNWDELHAAADAASEASAKSRMTNFFNGPPGTDEIVIRGKHPEEATQAAGL